MADTDVWALSSIGSPAATDRIPIATGSGAGGYSLRSDFLFKDASGKYIHNGASANYSINFADVNPSRGIVMDIANNGASGLTGAQLSFTQNTIDNWVIGQPAGASAFAFWASRNAANNGTEIARFTGAGNLGIGTTAPSVRFHVKSSGEIARLETTDARAGGGHCFASFYDPTARKGYIGYLPGGGDAFYIVNELNGALVLQTNGYSVQLATNGYFHPSSDNGQAVGAAANRWNVIYAASGTINTSDEREKTWRGAPNEAELRAAKRIIAELGFYQWNDAIAEKGAEGARYHFGPRAQQVWAIMADEELIDPLDDEVTPDCKYAFLCWDEWDAIEPVEAVEEERDEDDNIIVHAQPAQPGREAGNRFGVRSDQLTMFLIAAQEARLAALEAAL